MSANKYANLPDIDTAQDVYETEDVIPSAHDNKGDSSDEDGVVAARSHARAKNADGAGREELDSSNLMGAEEASKKFRKAERKHHRPRIQYTYPPSPTSSPRSQSPAPTSTLPLSLAHRLRLVQAEVAAIEAELADPSNPLLHSENDHIDTGELIRGVVDVKGRLDKISKVKEGRGKLVSAVLGEEVKSETSLEARKDKETKGAAKDEKLKEPDAKDIAEMDKRVGTLEKTIGSSSTALDEQSPLTPPLLPMLTRMNGQLTLLTQPRHVDSISRRLKLLLSDLERVSSANAQQHASQRRQSTHPGASTSSPHPPSAAPAPAVSPSMQDQLAPVLSRLAPLLPHIPHILTRLRTLSSLHTSAASFQSTLESQEEEQRKIRAVLAELSRAVEGVESSLSENETVVKRNVQELEERVEVLVRRVDELQIETH